MTISKLERTAQNAYRVAQKFIEKYGVVSGLSELYWQYRLNEKEIETILDNLVNKEIIDDYQKQRVIEEVRK